MMIFILLLLLLLMVLLLFYLLITVVVVVVIICFCSSVLWEVPCGGASINVCLCPRGAVIALSPTPKCISLQYFTSAFPQTCTVRNQEFVCCPWVFPFFFLSLKNQ